MKKKIPCMQFELIYLKNNAFRNENAFVVALES